MKFKSVVLYIAIVFCFFTGSVKAQENFDSFFCKFKKDCVFQASRIADSCLLLQNNNFEDADDFDTIMFLKEEWLCDSFAVYTNEEIQMLDNAKLVILNVADTGILLHYYFVIKDDEWYFCKLIDYSM